MNRLEKLTLEEKIALISGTNFMYTNEIKRLNIKALKMADGPHGLRVQIGTADNGISTSEKATAFPPACTIASSWNIKNAYKIGECLAKEAKYYGVDIILGPGINIKRNPLGGRNFEYFSEDPYLAGMIGKAEVAGIEDNEVGVSLKHFALNNSENYRFMGDSICDIRAIREIYLKPFEMVVKDQKVETLMSAYNKINGTYCSENKWLLTDILRNEWNFKGLVMTDWGGSHNRVKMLEAGLDLEMPGDTAICKREVYDAIKNKTLAESVLNKAVSNVLNLIDKHNNSKKIEVDFNEHYNIALSIAIDSAVLLKNNNDILPLNKNKKYLIIGDLFKHMRYQGSGSSMINPAILKSPFEAFNEYKLDFDFVRGYKEASSNVDNNLIEEALIKAREYEDIILFLGLTDLIESEGKDRDNLKLPENQLALVNELIKLNKKLIVVLYGGSPIELPFINHIEAILNMYLPGEAGGEATYKLLFGDVSPSGKLAETWPLKYSDVPLYDTFGKEERSIYKESILVGYRYYLNKSKEVLFPFGYGLSYTKFKYKNLKIDKFNDEITIKVNVKNVGNYDASCVVELFVSSPINKVFKPKKELKGFEKIYLKRNEEKEVIIKLNINDLAYFNILENKYIVDEGNYIFNISSDCNNSILSESLIIGQIKNEDLDEFNKIYQNGNFNDLNDLDYAKYFNLNIPSKINKKPITLDSRFSYLNETLLGKILYNAVLSVAKRQYKNAMKLEDGAIKDNKIKGAIFLKRILESNSLISMSMCAGKSFPYNFACGFRDLANGHLIKGIKHFLFKIKDVKIDKGE